MRVTFKTTVSGLIQATLTGDSTGEPTGFHQLIATASTVEGVLRNLAFEVKQSGLEQELARQVAA